MAATTELSDLEQMVLLALVRLGDEAYAVPVRREVESRGGRTVSLTAVYAALERLERGGLIEARLSEPVAQRGGRARRMFRVRRAGARALREASEAMRRMWAGLEAHPDLRLR